MIVHGGAAEHRWTVTSTDHHSATGTVLRRTITITIEGAEEGNVAPAQLVLDRADAKRLASAIHHHHQTRRPHMNDHVKRILEVELKRAEFDLTDYHDRIADLEATLRAHRASHQHAAERIHAIRAELGHKKAFG